MLDCILLEHVQHGIATEMNGYSLVWVQSRRVRPQELAVIELLKNADTKGLDPEDYDGSRWQVRLLKLDQTPAKQDLVHSIAHLTSRQCRTSVQST